MCCSSTLNPQVLFYDSHNIHFDGRELDIIHRQNIHYFILKAGDSVYDQKNDNVPNMNLNILCGNTRMNWMRHHVTLKYSPSHMNYVLVETWNTLKLSSVTITHKLFKKTPPRYPPDIGTNNQACLAGTKQSNIEKADEIGRRVKANIEDI